MNCDVFRISQLIAEISALSTCKQTEETKREIEERKKEIERLSNK